MTKHFALWYNDEETRWEAVKNKRECILAKHTSAVAFLSLGGCRCMSDGINFGNIDL